MGAVRKIKAPETSDAYLGVTSSTRGMAWRERLDAAGTNLAVTISQRHDLPDLLGRVLAARGIGLDEVPVALNPTVKALMPDPSVMRDMDAAAARLARAIQKQEKIAIFGDYDVDGACSCALLTRFLAAYGLQARTYIPDRISEGYGPNPEAIEQLIGEGAQLIVTVDCGTTSHTALRVARPLRTDVLVIDHHQADAELPDVAAVVNPNRQDDVSGLGHLCAAGVVFMLIVATARVLRREAPDLSRTASIDLLELLDLVALATVCDVVPLKGLNRAYVTKGLQVMHQRCNVGLKALADAAALSVAPTTYHLGFVLGPRINAGGRIGDAALGARLLSISDEAEAGRIAALLDKLNRERKAIEKQMLDEAVAHAGMLLDADPDLPLLVVASDTWHKGVVGLTASRLVEKFQRPACAIAWDGPEEGTGSLRSIAGVDIGSAVRAAVAAGLLKKGGGHAMAAGLTVLRNNLGALQSFMREQLLKRTNAARSQLALEIDGALTPVGVTDDLMALLERAGPYGHGHPQPRFAFPSHRVKFAKVVGDNHVRCTLEGGDGSRLDAVAFRAANQQLGTLLLGSSGMPLHVAGTLRRDTWNGRDKRELVIEDAADPRSQR